MADFIINLFNLIIKAIAVVLNGLLMILPPSPFNAIDNSAVSEFIGGLNWIIPISSIITVLSAWVLCVATYYIVQFVLRWVKAID